jgi:hypothetical protein
MGNSAQLSNGRKGQARRMALPLPNRHSLIAGKVVEPTGRSPAVNLQSGILNLE